MFGRLRSKDAMIEADSLVEKLRGGELTAAEHLSRNCALLHRRLGTYAEVAKRTGLDPRTTRKYVEGAGSGWNGQHPGVPEAVPDRPLKKDGASSAFHRKVPALAAHASVRCRVSPTAVL